MCRPPSEGTAVATVVCCIPATACIHPAVSWCPRLVGRPASTLPTTDNKQVTTMHIDKASHQHTRAQPPCLYK